MPVKVRALYCPCLSIAVLAVVWFCTVPHAAGQIGPVLRQPPVPAAAETTKSDEAKSETKKSDAAAKSKEEKSDPVRDAWEKFRSLSLADFINWVRLHGLSVVLILLMATVIFYLCAVAVILGALGVVLAHNPVHSALFLLLTLVSVAILFLQQDAALVAIIQIVVYASAIVVLFVFVIALLGVDQHESFEEPSPFQRPLAIALGALLFVQVVVLAGHHWATGEHHVLHPDMVG